MENRNLDKAFEIIGKLLTGEEVSAKNNVSCYEAYNSNMEVYEAVQSFLKKMNLKIYEYNYSLFACAGENNRIFGFSNEELKKYIGLRLNKELYLCYYIMYHIAMAVSGENGVVMNEYVKCSDIINLVDASIPRIINKEYGVVLSDMEENSLKTVALLWDELLTVTDDETGGKASRASKAGYVKLTFNFLISQGMFVVNEDRYYAKDYFYAVSKNYFEEYRGRLLEILRKEE